MCPDDQARADGALRFPTAHVRKSVAHAGAPTSEALPLSFGSGLSSLGLPGSQEKVAGRRTRAQDSRGHVVVRLPRPYLVGARGSLGLNAPRSLLGGCFGLSVELRAARRERPGVGGSFPQRLAGHAAPAGSRSPVGALRSPRGRAELPAARAGWQLEWVRLPPPPLPPPPSPPPPGPFAAARGERGGAAGAAMEPDSVIEDKTIELMVSAARGTVCSSVRPAPGGPAHLRVRREAGPGPSPPSRPRPRPSAFPGLGPGAVPPDPSRSQAGPGPAPSMPLGSPPVLSPGPSLERPSLAYAVAVAPTRSSIPCSRS